jgi:hypothetical protein
MRHRVILLEPDSPPKPAPGEACNGCGVCCAAEPCPLGQGLSRRRHGACDALVWQGGEKRYVCGVLDDPRHWLPLLPSGAARWLARRWIAAGTGCDCSLQTQTSPSPLALPPDAAARQAEVSG